MRRPTHEEITTYSDRYGVTAPVAWRDYLQLRLAEATSRDDQLRSLCVWKGAFVMRFVLQSSRASGDLDATVGIDRDRVDEKRIRLRLMKACEDLGIEIPKAYLDARDDSLSFAPISWTDPEAGEVRTSIDLSLRENLILDPHRRVMRSGLVPEFEITHIDLNEQVAEKMRCLIQRTKVGDGHDVFLFWHARAQLDDDLIRKIVPHKVGAAKGHQGAAFEKLDVRHRIWEEQRGQQLPQDAPAADEMRDACRQAIERWIP